MEAKLFDKMDDTGFVKELFTALHPILCRDMRIFSSELNRVNGSTSTYEEMGSDSDKILKKVSSLINNLRNVFDDLDSVMTFLAVSDREQLASFYPSLPSQQDYYKYHLENYKIRLVTISDILGKIGHLLFKTNNMDQDRANGYNFKESIKDINPALVVKIETLLVLLKPTKDNRHDKLHTGIMELEELDKISIFEDLDKLMGMETDPLLSDYTDEQIGSTINTMKDNITDIMDLLNLIFDEFIPQLQLFVKAD